MHGGRLTLVDALVGQHVAHADAAVGATATHLGQVEVQFTRQLPRGGHGQHAAVRAGRLGGCGGRGGLARAEALHLHLLVTGERLEEAGGIVVRPLLEVSGLDDAAAHLLAFLLRLRAQRRGSGGGCSGGRGGGSGGPAGLVDQGDGGVHGHHVPLAREALAEHPGDRAGEFHGDLVGHDLAQGLFQGDGVALLHQPLQDFALDDTLGQFGQQHFFHGEPRFSVVRGLEGGVPESP
ncbi:hypothetical protein DEGR_31820 [Deinococcus grandis]|nr:hypothetical protein DEGR_31820 [Deinococcus grandis]